MLYLWPVHEFGTDLASPVELSCRTTPCVQPAGHGRSEAKAGSASVVDSAGWATKSRQTSAAVATYAEGAPRAAAAASAATCWDGELRIWVSPNSLASSKSCVILMIHSLALYNNREGTAAGGVTSSNLRAIR